MSTFVDKVNMSHTTGSGAKDLVEDRFDKTISYADSAYTLTEDYMSILQDMLGSLEIPTTDELDIVIPSMQYLNFSSRPTLSDIELDTNYPDSQPVKPILKTVPTISNFELPAFTFSEPQWDNPVKPTQVSVNPPGDAPVTTTPDFPTKPDTTLPAKPVLSEIVLPSPPDITIAEFDGELPNEVLQTPIGFSWNESPYNSEVWADLLGKVIDGLRNGGSALEPDAIQALWDDALLRQDIEDERLIDTIKNDAAETNFPMPQGAYIGRLTEAYNQIARNRTDLNAQLTIEQFRIADKNTQLILTLAAERVEPMLREFHNSQANRSIEAAKELANYGIQVFNALVTKFNAELERYKTQAVIYESKVKAALTKVEIFRAQIEGAKVSSEYQANLVSLYEKQISAIETSVKLYTSEMDGVRLYLEVEKNKLESYRLETEIYINRLAAEKQKYDIYAKELDAEKIKSDVYVSQVTAWAKTVDANKTELDAEISRKEAILKENALLIEQYRAELAGYASEIDIIIKKNELNVEGFKAEVAGFSAETEALGMEYSVRIKEIEAAVEVLKGQIQLAVAKVDASIKGYLGVKELQIEGTKGIMNAGAQLCASSINAVTASASIGTSYTEHDGYNRSLTNTLSEGHNYEEE